MNNAGGDPLREFHTMTIKENLRILRLNLIAPQAVALAALDGMLRRGAAAATTTKDGLIGSPGCCAPV